MLCTSLCSEILKWLGRPLGYSLNEENICWCSSEYLIITIITPVPLSFSPCSSQDLFEDKSSYSISTPHASNEASLAIPTEFVA